MSTSAPVRFALTGAAGGFARTLLSQSTLSAKVTPAVLCDLDTDAVVSMCTELGFSASSLRVCSSAEEVQAVGDRGIAVVASLDLLVPEAYDVLVEATGSPKAGFAAAEAAVSAERHVVMVSKEVESVNGVELAEKARSAGVVYTPAHGDQPANLIEWYERVAGWGLEVVAIGKSGEYDLVFDPATETVQYLDQQVHVPELAEHMSLGDDVPATLARRAELVSELPRKAAADYCEMAVVSSWTGTTADTESMHYPVARIAELADIYALRQDGGVLNGSNAVDVFSVLRRPDEASFAGGVFVVVRTADGPTWEILRGKGHIVSRDGSYACLYLPYHLMGVETVQTIAAAAEGRAVSERMPTSQTVLAGRAAHDLPAGTVLHMGGHHHDVDGVNPVLITRERTDIPDIAPLYWAAHQQLNRDVAAGDLLTFGDF
ncbi:MAG TPA: homoserine dehydrogenase [Candidatus Nesterenkonia stercoripullorum]|uniref:Homoserine dehydrogenase n=1 Tax=Candidatus Nesterenkonia stercoripullorum TaxID=2838701 RepID=A0A9D1USY5_9MICC|nr:homoserine dehydrogenase [Candidatus Nesterenkonia stercoripullorum]